MSNEPKAGQGIDPELLAAYIDNRLSQEQRAVVEARLASDPDSYAVLVDTLKALDDEAVSAVAATAPWKSAESPKATVIPIVVKAKRAPMLRWVIVGGLLAAAAAIALVVWTQPDVLRRLRGEPTAATLMAKLVDAVGEERYVEPRLTGGFKFGPLTRITRSPDELSQRNLALLAAAGELQKRAQSDPTVSALHAWGVAQLLLGARDDAVRTLSGIGETRPPDPRLLNDLASAYLVRAADGQHPEDIPRALEAVGRSLRVLPNQPEALFNRALALELLNLGDAARAAWESYLAVDESTLWADEARRRLTRLSNPSSSRPSALRQFEVPCLLAVSQSHREGVMSELVERSRACMALAASRRDRQWLRFYESVGTYYQGNPSGAEKLARELDADDVDPVLQGPLRYVIASLEFGQGRFDAAIRTADLATQPLKDAGDSEGLVALHQLKGEVLRAVGEPDAAWGEYITALRHLNSSQGAVRRHALLNSVGMAAISQAMPHVAIDFLTVDEQTVTGASLEILRSEALLNRARAHQSNDDLDAAYADLEGAAAAASRAGETVVTRRLGTELHAAHAEIGSKTDPESAIAHGTAALDGFKAAGVVIKRARIHLGLARGLAALGRETEAMAQLDAGIQLVESQQSSLTAPRSRVSHLDSMWGLYGDYVAALVNHGRHAEALTVLERGRRLKWSAPDSRTLRPSDDTAVLVYFEADAWLGRWLLSSTETTFNKIDVGAAALQQEGVRLRRALQFADSLAQSDAVSESLGQRLLGGLELGRQFRRLVVVSDGPLSSVPFSVLPNPATGRPLLESIDVAYSPTLALFLRNEESLDGALPPRSIVAFHPSQNPNSGLPQLPGAAREVSDVAALYRRQSIVDGPRASSEALSAALEVADVLHFAGHAVLDPSDPWRSRLVVAPTERDPRGSWMFGGTNRTARLPLMVLAACSTSAGVFGRGQTAISLGSLLVAAGSPSVLATSWDIEDGAVAPLFVAFHKGLLSGLRPSAALRAAQKSTQTPPRIWAALTVIGI